MNAIVRVLAILALQFGFVAAASANMPTAGRTSQPVGHYEFCKRYADRCGPNAVVGLVRLTQAAKATFDEVNRVVNDAVFPLTDEENYGVPEFWTYPTTEGDCEDYALLKQDMLEKAGYPRSALLLTVLRQRNGDGHAVLTVTTDRGDLVLDSLEPDVRDWALTDYTYLKRQSARDSSKWVAVEDQRDIPVGSLRR